ncbi:MAG: copper chaperone [Bacteroidales bacterium]|nr:copper chaperone [Bacteroidales bacterium]
MKKILITLVLLFATTFAMATNSPIIDISSNELMKLSSKKDIRTDTIHVDGNCNMCKNRIEDAALIRGVKKADWHKHHDHLVVIYDANKVSISDIEKAVAEVGHDTENFKAEDKVYNKLPKCCLYREEGARTH